MPTRAMKPCAHQGCPELTVRRLCAAHAKAVEAARGTSQERGYGADWRKRRNEHLAREPLCRACDARGLVVAATDVDHIVPRRGGGGEEDENLQSLCGDCHKRKTALEDGGFGNPRGG
jgi:5-methylcytosine-specific restriction protein A